MIPLTYYGSTYHCEVGVISRPSIKLAGVDSLEPSFRFKTMAAFDEGMMLLARGRSVTELSGVLLRDGGCNQGKSVTCKRSGAFVMPMVHVSSKHVAMESCLYGYLVITPVHLR
eukprot:scaffold126080_cov40-Phaeocystis_antarctica.AAC.2